MTTPKVTEIPHTVGAGMRRTMIIVEKEQILAAVMAPLTGAIPMAEVMGIRRAVIRG